MIEPLGPIVSLMPLTSVYVWKRVEAGPWCWPVVLALGAGVRLARASHFSFS